MPNSVNIPRTNKLLFKWVNCMAGDSYLNKAIRQEGGKRRGRKREVDSLTISILEYDKIYFSDNTERWRSNFTFHHFSSHRETTFCLYCSPASKQCPGGAISAHPVHASPPQWTFSCSSWALPEHFLMKPNTERKWILKNGYCDPHTGLFFFTFPSGCHYNFERFITTNWTQQREMCRQPGSAAVQKLTPGL